MTDSPIAVLDTPATASPGPDIVVITAHPQMEHSRINRRLMRAARRLPATEDSPLIVVRDLYSLYPDYLIDVAAEQALLVSAKLIVWQHPIHWYSLCGLRFLSPLLLHGAHRTEEVEVEAHLAVYAQRLASYPNRPELGELLYGLPAGSPAR